MDAFEDCVGKGRLKKIEPDAELVARELGTAQEELERAQSCWASGRWGDVVTQSYFAMSRCARAAIRSRGYRDTNLYGLCVGLQKLCIEPGELPPAVVKQIREAKDIKDAVYEGHRSSPHDAKRLFQWAHGLAKAVFEQLALPGFDAGALASGLPEPTQKNRQPSSEDDTPEEDRQPANVSNRSSIHATFRSQRRPPQSNRHGRPLREGWQSTFHR
jgi:uncharacterized protein (UPF0332 family)